MSKTRPNLLTDNMRTRAMGPAVRMSDRVNYRCAVIVECSAHNRGVTGYLVGAMSPTDAAVPNPRAVDHLHEFPANMRPEAWMEFACMVSKDCLILFMEDIHLGDHQGFNDSE